MTPSLIQAVRQAEVIAPDERSITKFMPYVCISPEARDALLAVVDAASDVDLYELFDDAKVYPAQKRLVAALEALDG